MTELIDRADVERVLRDPRYLVPEADAAAARPMARFRSRASRFVNGPTHERRRARLVELLGLLDPDELAAAAGAHTRTLIAASMPADGGSDDEPGLAAPRVAAPDVAAIARRVPVVSLAERLGFDRPDDVPPLVAVVAAPYASGADSDAADAAITRLLAAAPPRPAVAERAAERLDTAERLDDGSDELDDRALQVQLLVQAFAATAALVEGAMSRASTTPAMATDELVAVTLRDDPPVRLTRRVGSDGEVVTLRLDGTDRDARTGDASRTLAFGAGRRACPAERLAVAMAAAIVEELRAC